MGAMTLGDGTPPRFAPLVTEALDNLVAADKRDRIIESALDKAGRAALPEDAVQLVAFAHGPLRAAAATMLDDETVWALVGELSVAATMAMRHSGPPADTVPPQKPRSTLITPAVGMPAPSEPISRVASPARRHTLGYQAAVQLEQATAPAVLVVSAVGPSRCAVCRRLTRAGYDVKAVLDRGEARLLLSQVEPRLVVHTGAPGEAERLAEDLHAQFGELGPPLLALVPDGSPEPSPPHVHFVEGAEAVAAFAAELLGPGATRR